MIEPRTPSEIAAEMVALTPPGLVWLPEQGMGFYPTPDDPGVYDADYFEKYQAYAATPLGEELTRLRVNLVRSCFEGELVDVGIGSGQFVEARGANTYGYDINPTAREWLCERRLWRNPYVAPVDAVSLWDVLEHIRNPSALLVQVRRWVFVSLPIFDGPEHVLRSKHFRRDEHCWYWTSTGLQRWMADRDFACVHASDVETLAGREGIATFAFQRV